MSKAIPTNTAASAKQRLLNRARAKKEDFNLLLTKYALERVLYRISQSSDKDTLVLKGALLFEFWTEQTHRPTRDADFLSQGENNLERFQKIFQEICALRSRMMACALTPHLLRWNGSKRIKTMKACA